MSMLATMVDLRLKGLHPATQLPVQYPNSTHDIANPAAELERWRSSAMVGITVKMKTRMEIDQKNTIEQAITG